MHASLVSVNGAGNKRRAPDGQADRGKSKDERQAEEESGAKPASKPGGFPNDPDDPTNPNEVRERHLNKIKR